MKVPGVLGAPKVPRVPKVLRVPVLRVPKELLRRVAAALIVLSGAGAGTPALAQQPPAAPYVGKPVVSIAIAVEGRPSTEPALIDALQIKLNHPLEMQDVRETMTHLSGASRTSRWRRRRRRPAASRSRSS